MYQFISFRNEMYQFIKLIHERHVPVQSFHSWTRCTKSFNSFTNDKISRFRSDSYETRSVKGVLVHYIQQITCLVTSHTRRLLARGWVTLWQDETVHRATVHRAAHALLIAPRCCGGRNFSEREIWVSGLHERERVVHLKDSFKKNDSFTNDTSLRATEKDLAQ